MEYICPRCGGTEIYFARRQEIKGLGGIYGQRAKMVNTPLCKACGETANVKLKEMTKEQEQKIYKGLAIFSVIAFGILFLWALSG
jgi:hypothetical protein